MVFALRARGPSVDPDPVPEWISDPELPPATSRRRLVALLALTVVVPLLWVIGTQLAGPDDGTLVDPHVNASRWVTGIPVKQVHGDTPLRAGDIVTAIGGRATTTLASAHGPDRHAGESVRYDIVRDGHPQHVEVKLFRFDVLAGFARTWLGFVLPTLALAIGLFVVLRRPREPAAHVSLWLGVLLLGGITGWLLGLRAIDLGGGRGLAPQIGGELCRTLKWSAFLHLAIVFPHPPRSRFWRGWVPIAGYALPFAVFVIVLTLTPAAVSPLAHLQQLMMTAARVGRIAMPVIIIAFVVNYRRANDPSDRRRLRIILLGSIAAMSAYMLLAQLPNALLGHPLVDYKYATLCFAFLPIAMGAAILRSQLFDLQVILRRSIVFGLLTAVLLAVAIAVLALVSALVGRSPFAAVVAGAVVALCFHPLRERLRLWVGGLIFGARDDPYQVVSALGSLEAGGNPQAALQRTAETLAATLRLAYVAIELVPGQRAAVAGKPAGGEPLTIPLGSGDGRLVLEVLPGREPFGRADRRLLEDVARQVSRLTDLVMLNVALRESRTRIISAREEERRRLQRDLHDGIGPTLAAQAMQLDLARVLLEENADEAERILGEIAEETKTVIAELRRVVDDLRPRALDQLGLATGIRERCRRFTLPVDVVSEGSLPPLPAAVEVAAYRIAIEAVNNAARHGRASSCRVTIGVAGDALELSVRDDGVGLPDERRNGVGLGSMRERAEELGGHFNTVSGAAGGTTIRATIPLAPLREMVTV